MTDSHYSVIIIGGGVVGLGVALEITRRFPHLRLLLLEKEDRVARHQSGHNSGVIHSGVYYKPGSLKARLCVTGAAAMVEFCREHSIAHNVCGKVIVATHADELPRLEELRQRGEANGLAGLRMIGPEELREIEPHATGLRALVVPSTGITDYARVCEKYAELVSAAGGTVLLSAAATGIRRLADEIVVETSRGAFSTAALINCAGLFSDRISQMAGDEPGVMIVPFRGEYYDLIAERATLVKALIYPVPDPRFPFLGVHFTRRITGRVDAGPNAVFALAREGYRHTDINLRDLASAATFPGFWRMAGQALAQRSGRVAPVAFEAGLRSCVAALASRGRRERLGSWRLRSARSGAQARRSLGRRFPIRAFRQNTARTQRTIAGGHSLADHWQGHRRDGRGWSWSRLVSNNLQSEDQPQRHLDLPRAANRLIRDP